MKIEIEEEELNNLKEFKKELIYIVDRIGSQSGDYCNWDPLIRDKMTAKEWADIIYQIHNDNEEFGRVRELYLIAKYIKDRKPKAFEQL